MSDLPPVPATETKPGFQLEHFRIAGSQESAPGLAQEKRRRVRIQAPPSTGPFLVGPSGGVGGGDFASELLPGDHFLREIHVRHDRVIRAVAVGYARPGASLAPWRMFGGTEGRFSTVRLRDGEYITAIGGSYGTLVNSLEIVTNYGSVTRFGDADGTVPFHYHIPSGLELCGLGGRASDVLHAVGLMFRIGPSDEVTAKMPAPYRQGPAGDVGGVHFEDPPLDPGARITGIVICHTYDHVSGVGLQHEHGGETHLRFNGEWSGNPVQLSLEPDEHIVGIGGSYWADGIRGIYLLTNKRVTQTYGCESRYLPFMFKTKRFDDLQPGRYEVTGLFGQAGSRLNALGIQFRARV